MSTDNENRTNGRDETPNGSVRPEAATDSAGRSVANPRRVRWQRPLAA